MDFKITQEELNEVERMISEMPTKYGMPLFIFLQQCFEKRKQEQQAIVKPINSNDNGNV